MTLLGAILASVASGLVGAVLVYAWTRWHRNRFSRQVWRAMSQSLTDDARVRGDGASLRAFRRKSPRVVQQ